LIEPIASGRFAFAHALVRQTLYGDLQPSRRIELHSAVGGALEGQSGDDEDVGLADLAHHYYQGAAAGVAAQAVAYATRAGQRAMRLATTIKTGQFCSYTPDPRFRVTWRLG
jgi:hypothetical protein